MEYVLGGRMSLPASHPQQQQVTPPLLQLQQSYKHTKVVKSPQFRMARPAHTTESTAAAITNNSEANNRTATSTSQTPTAAISTQAVVVTSSMLTTMKSLRSYGSGGNANANSIPSALGSSNGGLFKVSDLIRTINSSQQQQSQQQQQQQQQQNQMLTNSHNLANVQNNNHMGNTNLTSSAVILRSPLQSPQTTTVQSPKSNTLSTKLNSFRSKAATVASTTNPTEKAGDAGSNIPNGNDKSNHAGTLLKQSKVKGFGEEQLSSKYAHQAHHNRGEQEEHSTTGTAITSRIKGGMSNHTTNTQHNPGGNDAVGSNSSSRVQITPRRSNLNYYNGSSNGGIGNMNAAAAASMLTNPDEMTKLLVKQNLMMFNRKRLASAAANASSNKQATTTVAAANALLNSSGSGSAGSASGGLIGSIQQQDAMYAMSFARPATSSSHYGAFVPGKLLLQKNMISLIPDGVIESESMVNSANARKYMMAATTAAAGTSQLGSNHQNSNTSSRKVKAIVFDSRQRGSIVASTARPSTAIQGSQQVQLAKPNLLQRLKDAIACSNGGDGMSLFDDLSTSSTIANAATMQVNVNASNNGGGGGAPIISTTTMASTASSSFFFNTARSPTQSQEDGYLFESARLKKQNTLLQQQQEAATLMCTNKTGNPPAQRRQSSKGNVPAQKTTKKKVLQHKLSIRSARTAGRTMTTVGGAEMNSCNTYEDDCFVYVDENEYGDNDRINFEENCCDADEAGLCDEVIESKRQGGQMDTENKQKKKQEKLVQYKQIETENLSASPTRQLHEQFLSSVLHRKSEHRIKTQASGIGIHSHQLHRHSSSNSSPRVATCGGSAVGVPFCVSSATTIASIGSGGSSGLYVQQASPSQSHMGEKGSAGENFFAGFVDRNQNHQQQLHHQQSLQQHSNRNHFNSIQSPQQQYLFSQTHALQSQSSQQKVNFGNSGSGGVAELDAVWICPWKDEGIEENDGNDDSQDFIQYTTIS